jgi:lipoprotein NlpI
MPAERFGALWLYLARVRTGAQDVGKQELEATFARTEDDAWPKPIADYYLGHIDAAELLARARKIETGNPAPACDAGRYIAELQAALTSAAAPDAVAECKPTRPAS